MSAPKIRLHAPLVLATCLVLAAGCGRGNRDERAYASLEKEFISYYLKTNPTWATMLGDHRYDDRLDDMSEEAIDAYVRACGGYLDRLRAIDTDALSRDRSIDARCLADYIELILLDFGEERVHRRNPMLYAEMLSNSLYGILANQSIPLEERLDRISRRLEHFPRFVDQATANLDNPSKLRTRTAIDMTKGLVAFIESDVLPEADKVPGMGERMMRSFDPAREGLARYTDFLEKDLVNRSFGEMRIGDAAYRKRFKLQLGTDLPPEEMVAAAYRELDAVHERMYALAAPLYEELSGANAPSEPDFEERIRIVAAVLDDIANDHPPRSGLLAACTAAYAEAERFVRERDLVSLPEDPLLIVETPSFLRAVQLAATHPPGPLDKGGNFYFMVSPIPDYLGAEEAERHLREYNNELLRVVTVHEAMPGHYVQLARSNRVPSFVRSAFYNMAFIEGWAVYCQGMMVEEGFRGGDPRFALAADKYYLRVVINALLDSGMHRENMQEEEAVRLITHEGFQDGSDALAKWRRSVGIHPCFLSSYFVGALEIRALREDARREWGGRFTLKDFHERLLACGSIPPKYAREILLGSGE
jgi:uncharacterized protein (DUF885 family)